MRLLFAGTPPVAATSLQAVLDSGRHDVLGVLTRPAARAGRGRGMRAGAVEELARNAGIQVYSPAKVGDPEFLAVLTELAPECCPVVAYGALLPQRALDIPRQGWVNLHFSLLPAWRGAAPVQRALLAGDDITGASTFRIEAGMDTGPVFGTVTESIRPHDTAGDLLDRLADAGSQLLLATLDGIEAGRLNPQPQPADGVSLAPKMNPVDARVDWTAPALRVDRLIRACTPEPGAWTELDGVRIGLGPVTRLTAGVIDAMPARGDVALAPGELHLGKQDIVVGTVTEPVRLSTVQPPGKRMMPAADWARGVRLINGVRFA